VTAVAGRLVVAEARLVPQPAELRLGGRGGEVDVDGKSLGKTPLTLALDAGHHALTVSQRGHEPWLRELDLGRGQRAELLPSLPLTAQRRASRWLFGVTCVAAAMTVAAGAVWGQAEGAAQSILSQQQRAVISAGQLMEYQDDRARRDAWRTGTVVALGVTVALGGVTAALYAFDAPRRAR
jgi:hypothetical protein